MSLLLEPLLAFFYLRMTAHTRSFLAAGRDLTLLCMKYREIEHRPFFSIDISRLYFVLRQWQQRLSVLGSL